MKCKYPVLLFICSVAFLLLYSPSVLYFLSDDFDTVLKIQQNNYILHSFRPLTDLTVKADYLLWKDNAAGYHFTNILLHLFSTAALYIFTKQLYSLIFDNSEINRYAFLTAAFFLFYPFHSESLFWIVGRGASLSTLMALLSLYYYLGKGKNKSNYFFSLFFFIAGAFSYEVIWILPFIITIISLVLYERSRRKKEAVYVIGFWAAFLLYLIIRFYLTEKIMGSPYDSLSVFSFEVLSRIRNFMSLATRSFIPPLKASILFAICTFFLIALLLFTFYKLKGRWDVILRISIPSFFICMLPVIFFGVDTHDTEGERFLYLPSAFLSISVVIIFLALLKKQFLFVFSVILIAEISFLFYNYQSFKASSKITSQTVKAFSFLKNTEYLYCVNLPTQYKGAFIFRNGFESALKLYTPIKNVTILSRVEIQNPSFHSYNIFPFTLENAVEKDLIDSALLKNNTVVFNWKENGLEIYK